jgi:uncharacterized protein (DUF362 family)
MSKVRQQPEGEPVGGDRPLARRNLLVGTGLALGALGRAERAEGRPAEEPPARGFDLAARPPAGFVPLTLPGLVTRAEAKGDFASMMQPNQLWPRAEVARRLLERALTDLTGAPNLVDALKRFVHPSDRVAIKVNGIAGQVGATMAVNFELILPVVEALIQGGVPAERITVYEQYPTYLMGCRVNVRKDRLPEGVVTGTHNNRDFVMPRIVVFERIPTRYCRFLTEASALIDMTLMKDHSLCGFTGAMKNVTQGSIENPEAHHGNQASPQIAMLYNHPIVLSRARLHITDAFKIIYGRGPLDKDPKMRVPHGSVYASTDPVALDRIGWKVIDDERLRRGGMTLKKAGREPHYILRAADLGIGIGDMNDISLRSAVV